MHGLQQPCTGPLACSHGVGVLEFFLRLKQLLGLGVDPARLSLQLVELGLLCARYRLEHHVLSRLDRLRQPRAALPHLGLLGCLLR